MRKFVFFQIILHSLSIYVFALSYASDFEPEGRLFDIAVDYGKTFNDELRIINFESLFSPFSSRSGSFDYGLLLVFSPDKIIADLYAFGGITYYPFKKIFSLSCGFGFGCSMYALFNHFPYLLNIKLNIDIPIYGFHNLTIGMGVQHRNAIKLFGYISSDSYYGIYNSYFFEVSYRYIIK
jgi:hypothetical protein